MPPKLQTPPSLSGSQDPSSPNAPTSGQLIPPALLFLQNQNSYCPPDVLGLLEPNSKKGGPDSLPEEWPSTVSLSRDTLRRLAVPVFSLKDE